MPTIFGEISLCSGTEGGLALLAPKSWLCLHNSFLEGGCTQAFPDVTTSGERTCTRTRAFDTSELEEMPNPETTSRSPVWQKDEMIDLRLESMLANRRAGGGGLSWLGDQRRGEVAAGVRVTDGGRVDAKAGVACSGREEKRRVILSSFLSF